MLKKILASVALLISCTAAIAQGLQGPRQIYENYLQASAKGEDASQYMLEPQNIDEAKKKLDSLSPAEKKLMEGLSKAFGGPQKNQHFLKESTDGNFSRLYYGTAVDAIGYTEVSLEKVQGNWKIKGTVFHVNTKLPTDVPSQKNINTAYGAVKKQFPQVPVHGKINGVEFKPSHVKIWDKNTLTFSFPESICYDRGIKLWFHWYKNSLINTRMAQTVEPKNHTDVGSISLWVEDKGKKTKMIDAGDFGVQLALSPKNAKGQVPGYIVLQTSDPGTYIEGYFYATE